MLSVDDINAPADAIELLDVYLDVEKDWPSALHRHSVFRMPSFRENYDGLVAALITAANSGFDEESDVESKLRKEAIDVAGKLIVNKKAGTKPWSGSSFGRNQIDHARQGKAMRLDKALITAVAFNRIAKRYGLLDRFAIANHSVVVCGFYFSNLYRMIESYAGLTEQNDAAFARAVTEIARLSGQSAEVVKALAGNRAANLQTEAKEKAVTHLGSFPTLVAILQVIATNVDEAKEAFEEARNPPPAPTSTIGAARRPLFPRFEKLIVRRRQKMSPPKTINDEVIDPFGRVTWGPFAWPTDPDVADTDFPAPLTLR